MTAVCQECLDLESNFPGNLLRLKFYSILQHTMEFTKTYIAKKEHIDIQGIMDGLYYPFYMEYCRHDFIREVLGFDFEEEAKNGIYMVLSQYTIKFIRSLKENDEFIVSCEVFTDAANQPRLHFKQAIKLNGKLMTTGIFTGTCIPASGGRPYLPDNIQEQLGDKTSLDITLI
jgi:acyl-CoA thioester hydrolase